MCSGGLEAERKCIFEDVLPRMEKCGWKIRYSVYLLYWHKSTNTDGMSVAQVAVAAVLGGRAR
jgi:hypothetical protein